jgi:hypothetical protein
VSGADEQCTGNASACNYRLGREEEASLLGPAGMGHAVSTYLIAAMGAFVSPGGQIPLNGWQRHYLVGTCRGRCRPGTAWPMGVEVMDWMWLVMALETAVFLAFSAAMWLLVIKHADTQRHARGAGRMTPERAVVARGTEEPVASQQQAA